MASQTRTSLWRRTRFAVAQEDRVCTCFTRNAAEDCTPLRRRSSLTHHFERSGVEALRGSQTVPGDRKSTRLNSSHVATSYAVFCLKKKMALRADSLLQFFKIIQMVM